MKKELKIIAIVLGIMLIVTLVFKGICHVIGKNDISKSNTTIDENNNMKEKMNAIVVRVDEKKMSVISTDNLNKLIDIGFTKEGDIGYEQGQEIAIYFDGIIMSSYPLQLGNIGKIEIVNEKSNIEIPENILKDCYSSYENINVDVIELTNKGIDLNITDINDLSYNYSHSYKIYKKARNENYTEEGYTIGEDTTNSTAGFSRNRIRISLDGN